MTGDSVTRWVEAIERRPIFRHVFEIGLVAVAFLLYFVVRGSVVDRHALALENANEIIDLEQSLEIYWEPRLQEWIIDNEIAVRAMNFVYFWLDFPLIVVIGLFMYFRHRHEYTVARDARSGVCVSMTVMNVLLGTTDGILRGRCFSGVNPRFPRGKRAFRPVPAPSACPSRRTVRSGRPRPGR